MPWWLICAEIVAGLAIGYGYREVQGRWQSRRDARLAHRAAREDFVRDQRTEVKMWHRGGVPWYDAPVPPERHWCSVQTYGITRGYIVCRCACGGVMLVGDQTTWHDRNSRGKTRKT